MLLCLESAAERRAGLTDSRRNGTYAALGADYDLRATRDHYTRCGGGGGSGGGGDGGGGVGGGGGGGGSRASGALRVTYIGVTTFTVFASTVRAMADALRHEARRPSLLYLNVGAWAQEREPTADELLRTLTSAAEQLATPTTTRVVYGGNIPRRGQCRVDGRHYDDLIAPRLPARWYVHWRDHSELARLPSKSSRGRLRPANNHQPHLLNLLDLQLLFQPEVLSAATTKVATRSERPPRRRGSVGSDTSSIASPAAGMGRGDDGSTPLASTSSAGGTGRVLEYSPVCAGIANGSRFLEAYQHFCVWRVLGASAHESKSL